MILIDSSLWVDHFRETNPTVSGLLNTRGALCHPFVIGEIMMGNPKNRQGILSLLSRLPRANLASDDEVLQFVEQNRLFGLGVGYVDAHLLASVSLTAGATIWTRDRPMAKAAESLAIFANDVPRMQ